MRVIKSNRGRVIEGVEWGVIESNRGRGIESNRGSKIKGE